MFLTKKASNWASAASVKNSWKTFGGMNPDRLAVLDAVWNKEIGRLKDHCRLLGVDKDCLVVKADSSAAASELVMRNRQLLRSLNRYFTRPWLKRIRTAGGL